MMLLDDDGESVFKGHATAVTEPTGQYEPAVHTAHGPLPAAPNHEGWHMQLDTSLAPFSVVFLPKAHATGWTKPPMHTKPNGQI